MARELPKVEIYGTAFYVDVRLRELRQVEDPMNIIPFAAFDAKADYIEFVYDRKGKCLYRGGEDLPLNVEIVTLPPIRELDPVGWRESIGITQSKPLDKPDVAVPPLRNLQPNEINPGERRLPVVPIGGTDFLFDMLQMEFRQVDNPGNRISFDHVSDNFSSLSLLYDHATKNVYQGKQKDMPPTVELITLPHAQKLDPYGCHIALMVWAANKIRDERDYKQTANVPAEKANKPGTGRSKKKRRP